MKTELLTRNDLINIMSAVNSYKFELEKSIDNANEETKDYYIQAYKTYDKLVDKIDIVLGEKNEI